MTVALNKFIERIPTKKNLQKLKCYIYLANCFFQMLAEISMPKATDIVALIFLLKHFESFKKSFGSAFHEILNTVYNFTEQYCHSILEKL